jgi:hypothetical protein
MHIRVLAGGLVQGLFENKARLYHLNIDELVYVAASLGSRMKIERLRKMSGSWEALV